MRKKYLLLVMLFVVLMSFSCEKQEIVNEPETPELTSVYDLPQIKVEQNVLIFENKQDLEKTNIVLSK